MPDGPLWLSLGGACSCLLIAGTGITVSGSGSLADPYVISGTGAGGGDQPPPQLDGLPLAWDEPNQTFDSAVPYLDGRYVNVAGDTMTGPLLLAADPVAALGAATKQYVDANAAGYTPLAAVKTVADTNIVLSGLQTIDGHTLTNNQRVLLTAQTDPTQNGLWQAHAGAWTRPSDFASGSTAQAGSFVYADVTTGGVADAGSFYNGSGWSLLGTLDPVVDTDAQSWGQVSAVGDIVAGIALTRTGNVLDVDLGTAAGTAAEGDHTHPGGPLDLGPHNWTGLQRFTAGAEADTAPGSTVVNGVASMLLIEPPDASPDANAITVKRSSHGAAGWGSTGSYGRGQTFELLSDSAALTTATGTDPDPTNPVLMRVDRQGWLGIRAIHVAPGLRQQAGEAAPSQGLYIQQYADIIPLIIDNVNAAIVPGALTQPLILVRDIHGGSAIPVFQIDADGTAAHRAKDILTNMATFETSAGVLRSQVDPTGAFVGRGSDGLTGAFAFYTGDLGQAGYRAIINCIDPGIVGMTIIGGVGAQTAAYLPIYSSPISGGGTLKTAIDAAGDLVTYDNPGTSSLATVACGTAPAGLARARFRAGGTGTVPLVVHGHTAGHAVDTLLAVTNSATVWRLTKDGYMGIRKTSTPANGDVATSELMFWLDNTPGATKAMFKAKDSGGTVRTGSVALT